MKICGIENQEETSADFPDTQDKQNAFLLYVAQTVVEAVLEQVPVLDIQAVLDSHDDGEDGDDEYFNTNWYCQFPTQKRRKELCKQFPARF